MLKTQPEGYKIFILNKIIATTFVPIPDDLTDKMLMINHKDNDRSNLSADNLEWVEDVELWKDLGELGFKPGLWKVSNHGRVYGTRYRKFVKPNCCRRYPSVNITKINETEQKPYMIHRLVALLFIPKPDETKNVVNHVDGVSTNPHFLNLEWTDIKGNTHHAIKFGFMIVQHKSVQEPKLKEAEVRRICELLVLYNGDVHEVLNHIGDIPTTYFNVRSIRNGQAWSYISIDYFKPRAFITHNTSPIITEEKCRELCIALVKNNMNIRKTLQLYENDSSVTFEKLRSIVRKKSWVKISNEYF